VTYLQTIQGFQLPTTILEVPGTSDTQPLIEFLKFQIQTTHRVPEILDANNKNQ